MDEPSNTGAVTGEFRRPPELSKALVGMDWPVGIGTVVWLVVFVVMLVGGHEGVWRWTALTGACLGVVGLGIIAWQRAASRRGAKGAQRGL